MSDCKTLFFFLKKPAAFLWFMLLLSTGCRSQKEVYLFKNSASAYGSCAGPARTAPRLNGATQVTHNVTTETLASSKVKQLPRQLDGAKVPVAITEIRNAAFQKPALAFANLPVTVSQSQNIIQPAKTESKPRNLKAADPDYGDIFGLMVGLVFFALAALAIALGVTTSWWPWYLIALGLFALGIVFIDMLSNRPNHSDEYYLKAIIGIPLLVAALAIAGHYLLQLPSLYLKLLVGAGILFFFIRKMIRYYRAKATNAPANK